MDNLAQGTKSRYLLLILLCMAAVLIFAYKGGMDVDSCNYAVVAKEILRTNKWLGLYDPVYQGVFYFHFPLCIWATALFFKFLGISAFTAKLFSMLCGVILAGVIFYFGKLLKNHWVGFFAGVSFLFTNHILRLSRQCRMDIPVSLFITLAILSFILAQRRRRIYYLLFGLFTSLAIFSKDVTGLAPLAIVFIYLAMRRQWKEFFRPLFIAGLLVAIGPVLVWIWLDHNTLFYPWLHHNFLHLLSSSNFTEPWYYYITAIIFKYLYVLFFIIALFGVYLGVKEARRNKKYEFYLLIIWAVIFPLAFSFGRHKLHYFILPMFPAVSLLIGMWFDRVLDIFFKEPVKLNIARSIKYILIIIGIILLCFPINLSSRRFMETVRMAPVMDRLLKQLPEYEFIVYKQDKSSLLFYSQELTRAKYIENRASLEEALMLPAPAARFCYMSEQDFLGLSSNIRENYRVTLKYKDRILIASPKEPALPVILP